MLNANIEKKLQELDDYELSIDYHGFEGSYFVGVQDLPRGKMVYSVPHDGLESALKNFLELEKVLKKKDYF